MWLGRWTSSGGSRGQGRYSAVTEAKVKVKTVSDSEQGLAVSTHAHH